MYLGEEEGGKGGDICYYLASLGNFVVHVKAVKPSLRTIRSSKVSFS